MCVEVVGAENIRLWGLKIQIHKVPCYIMLSKYMLHIGIAVESIVGCSLAPKGGMRILG